jgi:glutathione S-transferase
MYAEGNSDDANTFNCIQRSHQNALEYLPNVLALQICMGLKFPITAAILGVGWSIGRIVYAAGYSSGDPAKRAPGSALAGIVYLALIGGAGYAGVLMALNY